jgi:HEAT repeat protein
LPDEDQNRPKEVALQADPEEEATKSPSLISQFVVFPLAIVIVGVSIYLFLGILTTEGRTARDYLNTIKRGGINSRWQAAYELVKVVAQDQRAGTLDPRFAPEMVRVFEDSRHDDPRVRRYLARAMEMVDDPKIVTALIGALNDADEETRLYAIHSLGSLNATVAIDDLLPFVRNEDSGFRKAAVYALGQMVDGRVDSVLKATLHDGTPDVRWNAALQMARRGLNPGVDLLEEMMDRPFLERLDMTEDQRVTLMSYAIKASSALQADTLRALIQSLREGDESLKVRQAAIEALNSWGTGERGQIRN